MHFVLIRLLNRSLLKNFRGVRHFTKAQILSLTDTGTYFQKHEPPRILLHFVLLHFALLLSIAFCVKSYYILRRKLLHFALLLHFVSVITICGVTGVAEIFLKRAISFRY